MYNIQWAARISIEQGVNLNDKHSVVSCILEGLNHLNGMCPCVPKYLHNDDTKCPCVTLRTEKVCKCRLFKGKEV